jgi:hypothetical protein
MSMRARVRYALPHRALALVALSLAVFPVNAAFAAVRLCKPLASSGVVAGKTEPEARKGALDAWKALARASGEEYASWRLAADKLLHCLPAKGGGYECMARAAPCTIDQAPGRRELRQKRIGI